MPVRKIGVSGRSIISYFPSIKTNSSHMCESMLESDYLYLCEFDPLVQTYEAQPVAIPYFNDNGKKVKYVPDFKVFYTKEGIKQKGYKFSLIEIKYLHELEADKLVFETKFEAARKFCKKENAHFDVFHDGIIKSVRLRNCKFLYRYLKPKSAPRLEIDFITLAKKLGSFTANDWVENIDGSALIKGQALSNLWKLVAVGQLQTDWEQPITNSSIITLKAS